MAPTHTSQGIRTAKRVDRFTYAIRQVVAEARKVEQAGRSVRYLNIGDPNAFGFLTPPHLVEAVDKAMRDGHNGYAPSPGIASAREAAAADFERRGVPVSADRVLITSGTSEGIELALTALVDEGEEVLVPSPTYPLYTAVLAKIGAQPVYYRTDPAQGWLPDLDHLAAQITREDARAGADRPQQPDRRDLPRAGPPRAAGRLPSGTAWSSSPTRSTATSASTDRCRRSAALDPDAPIISYSSLSKAYLAPGWRAGWMAVGRSPRLDDVLAAIKKLADGRLCSPAPMQYAVTAALTGDRSHQARLRDDLRARAELTTTRFNAMDGMNVVAPRAAFYAMPQVALPPGKTDEDFVLGLLRATGILCVYGSGFGLPKDGGYFRVVFLAPLDQLSAIYDDVAAFTREFVRGA